MTTLLDLVNSYLHSPQDRPTVLEPISSASSASWGVPRNPGFYLPWLDGVTVTPADGTTEYSLALRERLYALTYTSCVLGDGRLKDFLTHGPMSGVYYPAYLSEIIRTAAIRLGWSPPEPENAASWAFDRMADCWFVPLPRGCSCPACTTFHSRSDANWRDSLGAGYDEEDEEDEEDEYEEDSPYVALRLQSYSDRAEALPSRFKTCPGERNNSRTLFMGFELEVDVPDNDTLDTLKKTVNAEKRAKAVGLFAYDGSLNEKTGAEFKSIPASLNWHQRSGEIKALFDELAASCDISTPNGMGLHIHVGRDALSRLLIAKMMVFMNEEANQPFLESVARRPFNQWAYRSSRYADILYSASNTYGDGKYRVLNVSKSRTVEFRLFASTTDYSEWAGSMQFVAALIRWCGTQPLHGEFLASDFKEWVLDHSGAYPDLVSLVFSKDTRREAIVSRRSKKGKKGKKSCV